jgi:hypothetical protein
MAAALEARRLATVEADVPLAALDRAMHGHREVEDRRAAGIEAAGRVGLLTEKLEILQGAQVGAGGGLFRADRVLGGILGAVARLQLEDVAHDTCPNEGRQ